MAKTETWYDSQANAAKLISYAALLVLLGSVVWAGFSAWQSHLSGKDDYHAAMFSAIGGIVAAAFLYGISAIIDLLIVQCEALRTRR
jgi:drug/metabolite transporter (DMT)-like permease